MCGNHHCRLFVGHAAPTLAVVVMALGLALPALAQDDESANEQSLVYDQVVVTARRESEDLQEVPIAITAVSNEDIRRFDIRSVTDLQRIVPSLTATGRLGQNEESLTLRGQRATGEFLGAGAGPAVVSYFAEVPSVTSGPGLYLDLANVQVLKGPQGTLFGRNTTGGAVLYEPRRPEPEFSGYVQGTAGSLGRLDVEAVINVPVIDDMLMVRVAGQRQRRDGLAVDINSGTEYNNRNNWTVRMGVQFNPTERISNYLILQSLNFKENGAATILNELNPAGPFFALLEPLLIEQQERGIREVAYNVSGQERRETNTLINRTDIDLSEHFSLTNILSYTRDKGNRPADLDGTVLALADSLGVFDDGSNPNHGILTEELQLQGSFLEKKLDVRIGGFIERLRTKGVQTFVQRLFLGGTNVQLDAPQSVDADALFGHINLDLSALSPAFEGLSLSAGYRYTWDANSIGFNLLVYPGSLFELDEVPEPAAGDLCFTGALFPDCFVEVEGSDSGQSWNLGLDYQADDDLLVYASYRRGYKSGGFNPGVGIFFGIDVPDFAFGPERVDAIELGAKSTWELAGLAGRTNVALYKSWYNDVQVLNNVLIGAAATTATQNAAEATIQGFEIEGEIRPFDHVTIIYGYAFTDAEYVEYITPAGEDLSGLPFLYTPKHMINLALVLDVELPSDLGALSLFGSFSWQEKMFAGFTEAESVGSSIPAYGIANLRLDWANIRGTNVGLSLFVNNLADKEYRIANNPNFDTVGFSLTQYGEPRIWGVSLRAEF